MVTGRDGKDGAVTFNSFKVGIAACVSIFF